MKIHVLGVFNKRIEAYGAPLFTREAVEDYVTQFTRSLKLADDGMKANYKQCELVHLCDLDDLTGDVVSVKVTVANLDDVISIEE